MNAVLFDLDGTVMDTPGVIMTCLREIASTAGDSPETESLGRYIGKPLDSIVADLLPDRPPETLEAAKARFRAAFAEQTLPDSRHLVFPEVLDTIYRLAAQDVPVAIVTSKITKSAKELLDAGGILRAFDAVVGHDQATNGKPAPDLALHAGALLEASPGECLVIGDSPDDILMARAAGMAPLGVSWGVGSDADLKHAGADAVVPEPAALAGEIARRIHQGKDGR